MPIPKFIKKRDGKTARFEGDKIKNAIHKAATTAHVSNPDEVTEIIFENTLQQLASYNGKVPAINDIENVIFESARNTGNEIVGNSYINYRDKRLEAKNRLYVQDKNGNRSSTDAALLIESDSHEQVSTWDFKRIVSKLEEEAGLDHDLANDVAKRVEHHILDMYDRGIRRLETTFVRTLVDFELREAGLETQLKKQALLGIPTADLEQLLFSKSNENSNVANNNPEAVNLGIAETILKQWALSHVFSPDVANAHLEGEIHLHDLGYIPRVYCSSHSVEYIKKFGLNKVVGNLESKSNPPNSADVLNNHMQTLTASLQADYAGALGFGFLNILYASLLERPTKVVYGKFKGDEMSLEKKDLEKLIEQGVYSNNPDDKNYFEIVMEKREIRDLPKREYDQIAQKLIFAASQNAFSRGGQTLFIDFNIHTGVPQYLKNVPAIGPGGKYMVKLADGTVERIDEAPRKKTMDPEDNTNGDADDSQLEGILKGGHIMVYGDYERSTQKFARSLLDVWKNGDKDGRPFHFPKCDLHVDKNTFSDPEQLKLVEYAAEVTAINGGVYWMFDRGDGAVLAQCCRLKEKIEDKSMLKHPEKLRFTGFQNVTINLAQAAYKGKNLEGTLKEIDHAMELALKAHLQKKEYIQKSLDTDGSPLRSLGVPSDDGDPYISLEKSTYIYGVNALNEAVEALTGEQLHHSEKAIRTGLKIMGHMYLKAIEFKERTGLKSVIEETPAESTTRRFAMIDMNSKIWGDVAKKVVKGTKENPYYTNSIHFAPDADVGIIDRIVGQSIFHDPFIQAGAIIHAWTGEHRPDKDIILQTVKQTLENTRCSQLVYSPTYTECDGCGKVMVGERDLCENSKCKNAYESSIDTDKLNVVTRIVGYYSRVKNWNGSQKQINEDRKIAQVNYAEQVGRDMGWLYNPNHHEKLTVIQFAKHGCDPCKAVKMNIEKILGENGINGNVEYKLHYLDTPTLEGLEEAAMYNVPFDTFPSVVVTGKSDHWKKSTVYASKCATNSCSANEKPKNILISPTEVRNAIKERLPEYGIQVDK